MKNRPSFIMAALALLAGGTSLGAAHEVSNRTNNYLGGSQRIKTPRNTRHLGGNRATRRRRIAGFMAMNS